MAICEEQARSLLRASFSSMAGEAEDFGSAIFDRAGRLIAQAESTGTVSILYGLVRGVKHMLDKFPPDSLEPGDVLIGNDPWLFSGHKYDVTVAAPIFFKGADDRHDRQLVCMCPMLAAWDSDRAQKTVSRKES